MNHEGVLQQRTESVDSLNERDHVVLDIAQVAAKLERAFVLVVEALSQHGEHPDQRLRRALEGDDLTRQFVDATRDVGILVEELVLDLVDIVLDAADHGSVFVDNLVEHGVHDGERAKRQQLRIGLEAFANATEVGGFCVPDGDREVGSDEHVHLAEFDLLRGVEIARRLQHDELGRPVALELGPLVARQGVFNGEVVQVELSRNRLHLLGSGPVHADPGHSVLFSEQLVGRIQRVGYRGADAIHVYGVVNDWHAPSLSHTTPWKAAWHTGHVNSAAVPSARTLRRWRQYLADERAEAQLYRRLAARRKGEEQEILIALADAEGRHEAHWLELLGDHAAKPRRVDVRTGLLVMLARVFGSVFVLALAQRAEGRSPYEDDKDATSAMAADEAIHEEVIRGLAERGRNRLSGTFRAAVFGANDGLVSNLSLVLGVTAAGIPAGAVLATGVAGLLAGALSMGVGEYVSVHSQRELLDASTPDPEADKALRHLDVNANELALVYRARGMSKQEANAHARRVLRTPSGSLAEGVTIDANEAVGSGISAGFSSFCFFASGALIPLIPFFFGLSGLTAALIAAGLVGLALLGTGSVVGLLSGGSPTRMALRQLLFGYVAAGLTVLLGLLFKASGI